jgi:hypothetical protein
MNRNKNILDIVYNGVLICALYFGWKNLRNHRLAVAVVLLQNGQRWRQWNSKPAKLTNLERLARSEQPL